MQKIAFIITVYKNDKLKYFKEAIESIVTQDYGFENIHIYLGIDGDLPDDINNYIKANSYFYKVIKNDTNQGLAFTLNRLIETLEDETYIFRMDSDDICKSYRVSKQIEFMETHKEIEIIGGAIEEITEDGKVKMLRTYPKNTKNAKNYIVKASVFAHPTVCFRKSFFDKGFRYSTKHKFSQDLALWYKVLANNIQVSNIDKVVLSLRTSNDFYKRRSYKKALGEFGIYWRGIITLHGYSTKLIYPLIRLSTRIMPQKIVKIFYNEKFRKILNS